MVAVNLRISFHVLTSCFLFVMAQPVSAQQAIVNLPSADITPAGKNFVMHETQLRPYEPNPFWKATNFYCYGAGHHTELCLTTYNMGTPWSKTTNVGLGFKTGLLDKDQEPFITRIFQGDCLICTHV